MADMVSIGRPTDEVFAFLVEYIRTISPKYADIVVNKHQTEEKKKELIKETIEGGMYINILPFQKGIDDKLIIKMREKFQIYKSKVSFNHFRSDGRKIRVTTKDPIMIGYEYFYLLYKIPHMRSPCVGYINQYGTPVKPSTLSKSQYPFAQTPIRIGEDEVRNLVMAAGSEVVARLLGEYANNSEAVNQLSRHLLNDDKPGELKSIEMPLEEIIKGNTIIGVAQHMCSTFGVDLTPKEESDNGNVEFKSNN